MELKAEVELKRILKDNRLSLQCQVLSFDYSNLSLRATADVILIVTENQMILFPGKENPILDYDAFYIDEIALLSLPYSEEVDSVALRSDDLALHFHDSKTLWLRLPGHRSEFADILSEMHLKITGFELEIYSCEYRNLVEQIRDSTIQSYIKQIKCAQFAKQEICMAQGWLKYNVLRNSSKEYVYPEWQTRWFYLSRHDLWHFSSPEELGAFKFALSTPKPRRASLPLLGRISIPLRSIPGLVHDQVQNQDCFSISNPDQDQTHIFSVQRNYLSTSLSASEWKDFIQHNRLRHS